MNALSKVNISKLERLTTSTELNYEYNEVTNYAKPWEGSLSDAT